MLRWCVPAPSAAASELDPGSASIRWFGLGRPRGPGRGGANIVNDPNDWAAEHGEPRYILDLLKRIVTVSIETIKIVDALPPLDILDDQKG